MESILPIWEIHGEIIVSLTSGNRLVLAAPTGSGKSTQVPQMILDDVLETNSKVVVLQPRKVAARSLARRVAWERSVKLGEEVGYHVRFENHSSSRTQIEFITEGILLRWMQNDPELSGIGAVLFDEFHERNLMSDLALGLVKRLQNGPRSDLKIVVMSATIETGPVANHLGNTPSKPCPVLIAEGRTFPVETRYAEYRDRAPVPEQATDAVEKIMRERTPGDILVFMPGMAEIRATLSNIQRRRLGEKVELLPLHGDLPATEQDRAFSESDHRKIIVATNVAETSVTINGIRHVVDSGLARVDRFDAERGIGTLFIEEISRASADQRAGRAGRTAPGTCHRLWTESGHLNRPEHNTPEILRADLAEVVLLLHSAGVRQATAFDWLDKPDPIAVAGAEELLESLGALALKGKEVYGLTAVGNKMLRLPTHPRFSRMLVEASERGCLDEAALCAAFMGGRNILTKQARDDKKLKAAREDLREGARSDFEVWIRAWKFASANRFHVDACRGMGIHAGACREAGEAFRQILKLASAHGLRGGQTTKGEGGSEALGRCLLTAFADQLCVRRNTGTLECDLPHYRTGTLMRESVVQQAPIFVAGTIRQLAAKGGRAQTLLGMATAVDLSWIHEMFARQITVENECEFDPGLKRVETFDVTRFRDLVLAKKHAKEADPKKSGRALALAFRKGWFKVDAFNSKIESLIARVNWLCATRPELEFPTLDEEAILNCLALSFKGMTLAKQARGAEVREALQTHMPAEQWEWLEELAPAVFPWPDDKPKRLIYPDPPTDRQGTPLPPEIHVKLHECFRLADHPRVCECRHGVRLKLLNPKGRKIDFCDDWPAFKIGQYPIIRKDLVAKFPGMTWL